MTRNTATPPQQWLAILFLTFIFIATSGAFERAGKRAIVWALIYAGTLVFVTLDYKRFIYGIQLAWPALLLCGFIVLSTLWSELPSRTLIASIQYAYTIVIAIWVGTRFNPDEIFLTILIGFGLVVGLSIISEYIGVIDAYSQSEYDGAPRYMVGILTQKNVFGIAINFLLLAVLYFGIKKPKMLIPAYLIALLLVIPLIKTKSAGSLIIYLGTMALPVFWYMFKYKKNRLFIFLLSWIILLVTLLIVFSLNLDIVSTVLSSLGKDSSLTGRTMIWDTGMSVLHDNLMLGVGYDVFWEPGVFQEVSLIHTKLHGQPIKSFHNSFLEISVALGFIGFLLFLLVLLFTLFNSTLWFFKTSSPEAFTLTYMLLMFVCLSFIESIMIKQHALHTFMLMITLTIARRELNNNSNYKNI